MCTTFPSTLSEESVYDSLDREVGSHGSACKQWSSLGKNTISESGPAATTQSVMTSANASANASAKQAVVFRELEAKASVMYI